MNPIEQRAWARLTAEMAGDLHQFDHWEDVPEDVRKLYLDTELVGLAAKLAGMDVQRGHFGFRKEWLTTDDILGDLRPWRPLLDDGDAMRLQVDLRFTVKVADHEIEVFDEWGECLVSIPMQAGEDYRAATRRAIVQAAAEIVASAMKEAQEQEEAARARMRAKLNSSGTTVTAEEAAIIEARIEARDV